MSLFGSLASWFFETPIAGAIVDAVLSDDGGGAVAGATAPAAPAPRNVFTGQGASTLSYDGYDIDYGTGDVWGTGGYVGDFPTVFDEPWQTPPYFPTSTTSTAPSALSTILGGVLNAIVPSAQASPAVVPAVASAIGGAVGGAAISGGAGMIGAGMAAVARGLSGTVASALMALRARLTGATGMVSQGALTGFGRKTWASIQSWIRANPGTSAIGILTGLGLTVEQAAHFLAWGATTKKRSRSRGVSGRDITTSRRTIRKLTSMTRALQGLCSPVARHHHHFKRRK